VRRGRRPRRIADTGLAAERRPSHHVTMSAAHAGVDLAPLPDLADAPTTPAELTAEARRIHAASVRYWSAYPTAAFFHRPAPEVWTAADQVRHLTKAIRAVSQGLRLPRPVLLLLFRRPDRGSRSLDALRADYKNVLSRGGRAGRFAPRPLEAADETEAGRARVMGNHAVAVEAFTDALGKWPDDALDHYQLPHPLLGKLTVREMAFFTLLHNVHHVHVAERRRAALAPQR
jgi:hypothetical protein